MNDISCGVECFGPSSLSIFSPDFFPMSVEANLQQRDRLFKQSVSGTD